MVVPDSVELAVVAERLVSLGEFNIRVGELTHPSRYPPLFSLLLVPVYFFFPGDLAYGYALVWLFFIGGTLGAYLVGRRLHSPLAGALAATAFMYSPVLLEQGRRVLTDGPAIACLVLSLAASLFYVRGRSIVSLATASILAAACFALRPIHLPVPLALVVAVLAVHFTATERFTLRRLALHVCIAIAPLALTLLLTLVYNNTHFGSHFRTGYSYWCPIPYDLPGQTFSTRYISEKFDTPIRSAYYGSLAYGPWLLRHLLAALAGLILITLCPAPNPSHRPRRELLIPLLSYWGVAIGPVAVLYLMYFWLDPRLQLPFILPSVIMLAVGLVALLARLLPRIAAHPVLPFIPVVGLGIYHLKSPPIDPYARPTPLLASLYAQNTPRDAILITMINPVQFDALVLRGTERTWIPAVRSQEYADKYFAPKPMPRFDPPLPDWPTPHRNSRLLEAGARDPLPIVASERLDLVDQWVHSNRQVYFDSLSIDPRGPVFARLALRYHLTPTPTARSPLYRLTPKFRPLSTRPSP